MVRRSCLTRAAPVRSSPRGARWCLSCSDKPARRRSIIGIFLPTRSSARPIRRATLTSAIGSTIIFLTGCLRRPARTSFRPLHRAVVFGSIMPAASRPGYPHSGAAESGRIGGDPDVQSRGQNNLRTTTAREFRVPSRSICRLSARSPPPRWSRSTPQRLWLVPRFNRSLPSAQMQVTIPGYGAALLRLSNATPSLTAAGVVNGASFQSGPVSPGEIVSLFGSAIGPPTPASLALTNPRLVANSLQGVQVLF